MLAIIPARGGSKGLPQKNIKKLNGVPLIAYTIKAAHKANCISRIILTTDSEEIAKLAVEYGAEAPFLRPKSLAGDNSLVFDAFKHAIDWLLENEGLEVEAFAALNPTSPFRTAEDIDNAVHLFKKKRANSVISFTKQNHPIEWSRYIDRNKQFHRIVSEEINNRQEYKESYRFNGAVYVYKTQLIKQRLMYTNNSYAYIMPKDRSIDIDTIEDFEYAEYLLKRIPSIKRDQDG